MREGDQFGLRSHEIFEAVVGGSRIRSHTGSLAKDNRLLPKGWDPDHPDARATRPVGVDPDEENFVGGSDTLDYVIPWGDIQLPYTVEVELLYQVISPRYLADLFAIKHPEIARFRAMYEKAGNKPEVISRDKLVVAY